MICVFGLYELHTDNYELLCAGEPVQIEPEVFEVLAYLVQHHEQVVSMPANRLNLKSCCQNYNSGDGEHSSRTWSVYSPINARPQSVPLARVREPSTSGLRPTRVS